MKKKKAPFHRSAIFMLYYRLNPIIHLAIRPSLRAVNAHDHPIRGGIVATLASWVAHYIFFILISRALVIAAEFTPVVHILIGITALTNLLIGLNRYFSNKHVSVRLGL